MANIVEYMQRLQRILGDPILARFNEFDLLDYINEARGFVAAESECVRVLCPSTAGLSSISVTSGGTGYTSPPTVTLTSPTLGVTATAVATVLGGAVRTVDIDLFGTGYTVAPSISFGGPGTGAAATASLLPFAQITQGQEVYQHADFNSLILSTGTGAAEIIAINNIAVSWGSMKPTLRRLEWGDFQAYFRAYNVGAQGYPRVWAPYARGTTGSFYVWPIPSQNSQMDLDCVCLPQPLDLTSNLGVDPIPYPWTNAVPYKAAEIAVLGERDLRDLAPRYQQHFERRMAWAAAVGSTQTVVPDYYNSAARI